MTNSAPPPAYTPSSDLRDEAPPAFESSSSTPQAFIDSKPPLVPQSSNEVSISATQACASEGQNPEPRPPPALVINGKTTQPFDLVTVYEVKTHLVFLGAFARLKSEIKSQKGVDVRGSTDELWAIYLARAVDRFAAWLSKGLPVDLDASNPRLLSEDELPPLDVLMAWQAYLLNPRVYYEDGLTKKSQLLGISGFPFNHLNKIIDVDTLAALHPSLERQNRFESLTGQPWCCPSNTTIADTMFVPCPRCEKSTPNEVCWITNEKTGFAEHCFKARCHICMGVFNREDMMVRGLCDDIIKVRIGLTHQSSNPEQKPYISGTLLDWRTGKPDPEQAMRSNDILLKAFFTPASMKFTRGDWLAGSINYSIKQLETSLKNGLSLKGGGSQALRRGNVFIACYLVPCLQIYAMFIQILRQGGFIDKMLGLGWTKPQAFDHDCTVIHRCIARYHAWLDVMSQLSRKMLVPTLDIDLAWHTHQLKQQSYRIWTLEVLGQFIDHDDKVEENKLSEAYEQTAKYWEQRWGVPYHVCGCSRPPTHKPFNPGESISRIFRGKGKAVEFSNSRPQLISIHECDAPTTHPSEHNSMIITGQPLFQSRRNNRALMYAKWYKQMKLYVDKGKVPPDGWEAMNVQRSAGHGRGFMPPMPDPNLTPIIPYGAETCATHDGGVLNGENLTSSPLDGKHSAGVCAAGMGVYPMVPMGGFYIGPMGVCAGASNGGCSGGGGCMGGGTCGGGGCGGG
ncbi:Glycine-rich protein, partial [Rhizoctonia solani]